MLMKQKKMLVLTFRSWKQIYTQEMPGLVEMAAVSPTVEDFKAGLLRHLDSCRGWLMRLRRRRGSKFDSYSSMMDRMFMNCLQDRIFRYRRYGCFISF